MRRRASAWRRRSAGERECQYSRSSESSNCDTTENTVRSIRNSKWSSLIFSSLPAQVSQCYYPTSREGITSISREGGGDEGRLGHHRRAAAGEDQGPLGDGGDQDH